MALIENVVEFIVIFFKCIYYWLKAIFMFFVPHSYFRKDISGQVVLITGAGEVCETWEYSNAELVVLLLFLLHILNSELCRLSVNF